MLDPWIIEEIRRREEERKRDAERVELPLERPPAYRERDKQPPPEEPERGVTVIDI